MTWLSADILGRLREAAAERDPAALHRRVVLRIGRAVEVLVLRPISIGCTEQFCFNRGNTFQRRPYAIFVNISL